MQYMSLGHCTTVDGFDLPLKRNHVPDMTTAKPSEQKAYRLRSHDLSAWTKPPPICRSMKDACKPRQDIR